MLKHLLFIFLLSFSMHLRAANSVPSTIFLSSSSVNENSVIGNVIGTLSTADADVYDSHTYSLVAGAGGGSNSSFTIAGNQLLSNIVFNYEFVSSCSIRVQTNDGNGGVFEKIFVITVNNMNDVPYSIVLSNSSVNENVSLSSLVGNLSALDGDVGDVHTYTLVAGAGSANNASFTISGNQLLTATALNFEVKSSYSIRIQTNDGNGGTYQKAFSIAVNDVNEAPLYHDAAVSIVENLSNASNVLNTSATDVDALQVLTYSIVSGNTGGAFSINSSSGQISVANSFALNYEVTPLFSLVVRATDNGTGSLFDNAAISITITNVNDSPVFTLPGAQVVNEFTNLNISPIVINDEDLSTDSMWASLTCNHGRITLFSTTGLRFVAGDGVDDTLIGFFGSVANVSAALSALLYKSNDDYVGSDQVLVGIRDYGLNNNGVITIDKAVDITVNAVAVSFVTQTVGATICQWRSHLFHVNTAGTNPMTYQWKHNGSPILGATNDSLQIDSSLALDAGTYQCEVTNPAGIYHSTLVNLVVNATPQISFSSNEVCVGSTTNLTNTSLIDYDNIALYSWDFDDNNMVSSLASPSRVFGADGTFNVLLIVTSDKNCADTLLQAVVVNPYPQTNFTAGDICFVDTLKPLNNTTINAGTISYVWNFGDGSASIQKNPRHKYVSTDSYNLTLTSTSNKGCSTSKNQTITVNPSPIANFVVPDICDSTEAKFQGVSSISSGSIVHFWDFGDGDTNYNEINPMHLYVGDGTYHVQLRVLSDQFCSDSVVKEIKVFRNPALVVTAVNPLCYNALSGSISANSSQGMAPYFYSLNGGGFTLVPAFRMLGAGTYTLLVMDNRNCITNNVVVLTQPDQLKFTVENITDIKCAGAYTGSYLVVPEGGTPPYSFLQNKIDLDTNSYKFDVADTGYFANLKAKLYRNILLDYNGCKTRFNVSISEPSPVALSVQYENISCKGFSDGEIAVAASGGVGHFVHSIDGGLNYQSSNIFSALSANDYLVSVKDSNGCGASFNVNLIEPALPLGAQANVIQQVKCYGDSTATVVLSSDGGTGIVQYSLDQQNSFSTTTLLNKLPFGNHKAYVIDENNCVDSVVFSITQPANPLSIQNVIGVDALCYGNSDASASVVANGGTGVLKYSISNFFQSNNTFENLFAGTYLTKVKDANGCLDTRWVTLQQPSKLYFDSVLVSGVSCKNDAFGVANIKVLGGTSPYAYTAGSAYQIQGLFNTLTGGEHYTFVSDDKGCTIDTLIDIPFLYDLAKADFSPFVAGRVITFNNSSSNALAQEWNFGDGTKSFAALPIHQYASKGIYTVSLKVSNQCNSDSVSTILNIGSVGVDEEVNNALSLYPNPCDDYFVLDFSSLHLPIENSVVSLYDMLGNLLLHKQFSFQDGSLVLNWSTKELSAGKYFIHLSNNQFTIVKSVEVIH